MKVFTDLNVADLHTISEQVRRAEFIGYDGVGTGERETTPFLPLLLAAEHSSRLQLLTHVAIAFPRSPFITAQTAWELQGFSGGRFILGLGPQVKGHNERRFSTPWSHPGPRLQDYLRCLRAIWKSFQNEATSAYKGDYYSFSLLPPHFNPGPIQSPPPLLFIAAVNRYMLRLAGEECDGIMLHPFNTTKYTQEVVLPTLELGARKSGRSLRDIAIYGGGFVVTGRDWREVEQNREKVRLRIAFYASTRTYKPVLDLNGWGSIVGPLHDLSLKGLWNDMGNLITDEMLDAFSTCGPYDEIASLLKTRYGSTNTWINLPMASSDKGDDEALRRTIVDLHST